MTTPVQVRQLLMRDYAEVIAIDAASRCPWSEDDLTAMLRRRDANGMVAEDLTAERRVSGSSGAVLGFMFYVLTKTYIDLIKFAVHPAFRRERVGSQVVAKLVEKLAAGRRARIQADVPESDLAAQLFFRSCGFRAVKILPAFYPCPDLSQVRDAEAAYRMVYDVTAPAMKSTFIDPFTDRKLSDWSA